MATPTFDHVTPPYRTFCGEAALTALPRELARLKAHRAVIVCNPSIPTHAAAFERVTTALGDHLVHIFDGVREHSPLPAVEAARHALESSGADAVIAVGGGSAIVTARAATVLLAERRDVRELSTHRSPDGTLVSPKLLAPKLPQWVVPSTPTVAFTRAGSAVRDPVTGDRFALFDPKSRAQGILLDPEIAATAPIGLVQSSALNALSAAIEGLQALTDNPLAEALLAHGLRTLTTWLPRLSKEPSEPEPRVRLILAAALSGQGSESVGGGLTQALTHAIGPRSTAANGIVEAILLPHVLRFNAPVTGPRLERVAEYIGISNGGASVVSRVVDTLQSLFAEIGVPAHLRDIGLTQETLYGAVDHVLDDWFITRVPRPVERADVEALLEAAW